MATWNTVNISYIHEKNRIDSEFYKENDVELEFFLNKVCSGVRLKNVVSEIQEKFSKSMADKIQYNDIGNTNTIFGTISENVLDSNMAPGRATYINKVDDILISTVRPNRNANAIVNDSDMLQVGSNGFCNVRTKYLDPNYIFIFTKTKYFINTLIRATTSSMYPSVSNIHILNAPFFIPNNTDMELIAYKVNQARVLLNISKKTYSKAKSMLGDALDLDYTDLDNLSNKFLLNLDDTISSRRLDPEFYNPRTRIIVQRIKSLKHTTINKHFFVRNGFPWNSNKFLDNNSGEPVIRIRDIKPTYINNKQLTSIEQNYANTVTFNKAKAGDVVIGMDGLKYFYSSILEEDCMVNQRVCHIEPKNTSQISSEYVTFMINSEIGQSQLLRDMTIATTVGHITNKNIAKLVIPIISMEFHDEITALVRESIDLEKNSKELLEQAKLRVEQLIEEVGINS